MDKFNLMSQKTYLTKGQAYKKVLLFLKNRAVKFRKFCLQIKIVGIISVSVPGNVVTWKIFGKT